MKIFSIICLIGWGSLVSLSLQAQKKVPHSFRYAAQASEEGRLKEITQVSYSGTSSIRLFFEDVQLGENSYLLLEGSDGAEQKLDAKALQHWSNSSAYFNGQNVKVSLYQAAGEEVMVKMKELRVNDKGGSQKSGLLPTTAAHARMQAKQDLPPWSQAVGRFTDGAIAIGTGWIAANGAIVTHRAGYVTNAVQNWNRYDLIEFNVPPSNPDGTINHSAPEDQYPLNHQHVVAQAITGKWIVDGPPNTSGGGHFVEIKKYQGNKKNKVISAYAIIEVLPNSKGEMPGQRMQQYFQVLDHPNGPGMEGETLEIFHHGEVTGSTANQTLQTRILEAENSRDFIRNVDDKDIYLTYNPGTSREGFWNEHMYGAPITYQGSNVAVGVHLEGFADSPALGLGFRYEGLRQKLSDFFSSDVTHVDQMSVLNVADGEIDKPYRTIGEGAQAVVDGGTVSIAKGKYHENLTINRPMKLVAPVGYAVIGEIGDYLRTEQPNVPASLVDYDVFRASEGEDLLVEQSSLKSFPNPFTERTELHYTLTDNSPVQVKVFDMLGQEVQTLVQEDQPEGEHSVQWDGRNRQGQSMPTGLYIMQLKTGEETSAVRVMKQ
ncbi:MAG: FlgD immunoglobulin-like domain containing protein [Cyclobacteriaceae bacterium]